MASLKSHINSCIVLSDSSDDLSLFTVEDHLDNCPDLLIEVELALLDCRYPEVKDSKVILGDKIVWVTEVRG